MLFSSVLECVTEGQKNRKLVVSVVTYGGQANVAYRVARLLQTMYDEVIAFVPSVCKSAGTLIVAGAHGMVGVFGEIGPLDVQLTRRDEIWGRRSGLTTRSALVDLKSHSFDLFEHFLFTITARSRGSVSFRLAAEIAGKITAEMMSGIYAQINPEALGQDFMDLNVAREYCERLNKVSKNLRVGAVRKLVFDYPTHDFVIDFEEARGLFHRVELPTPTLLGLLKTRSGDFIRPKTGPLGIVELLTIPAKVEAKSNQKTTTAEEQSGAADGGDSDEENRRNHD